MQLSQSKLLGLEELVKGNYTALNNRLSRIESNSVGKTGQDLPIQQFSDRISALGQQSDQLQLTVTELQGRLTSETQNLLRRQDAIQVVDFAPNI